MEISQHVAPHLHSPLVKASFKDSNEKGAREFVKNTSENGASLHSGARLKDKRKKDAHGESCQNVKLEQHELIPPITWDTNWI